jgi:hypothetical protein
MWLTKELQRLKNKKQTLALTYKVKPAVIELLRVFYTSQ